MDSEELRRYLDGVEGNLHGPGKADVLREIESHIYDRAEALARTRGEEPGAADFRRAMEELGDPSDLAVSYSGERSLVAPKEYAAYWYLVLLVFAVHLTMLFLAVATRARFNFFPFNVLPRTAMEGPAETFLLVSLGVQAFLFDAGLVLMSFFLLRKTFRRVELPNLTFRVETGRRASLFRAAFALALGVCLGAEQVRDHVFRIVLPPGTPADYHTLILPPFHGALPFILAFLALAFVKDLLYAFLGERTLTVGADLATWIGGVALCVLLFARDPVAGLPPDFPLEDTKLTLFNAVMARLLGFFFICLAAIFAARAVKRFLRLLQIWGEQGPGRA